MSLPIPIYDPRRGVHRFSLASEFQRGPNPVEVLLPDSFDPARRYATLYVLPVEAGVGGEFGDGLQTLRQADLHNRHDLICVMPAFDTIPWYAAHATDPSIRHERYILDALIPTIESLYPTTARPQDRLLLGFSKSGWGALTLLLRNPATFGCAASWDAPLMLDLPHFGYYGTADHFGTRENFAHYLPQHLLRVHAPLFQDRRRIVLLGSCLFGPEPLNTFRDAHHTAAAHDLMTRLGIAHDYSDVLPAPHAWHPDWLVPAVTRLAALAW